MKAQMNEQPGAAQVCNGLLARADGRITTQEEQFITRLTEIRARFDLTSAPRLRWPHGAPRLRYLNGVSKAWCWSARTAPALASTMPRACAGLRPPRLYELNGARAPVLASTRSAPALASWRSAPRLARPFGP